MLRFPVSGSSIGTHAQTYVGLTVAEGPGEKPFHLLLMYFVEGLIESGILPPQMELCGAQLGLWEGLTANPDYMITNFRFLRLPFSNN